jgi:hypothetical protein
MGSMGVQEEPLVGLGPAAETRLSAEWARRRNVAHDVLVIGLLVGIQVAWLAALAYAAYVFLS